MRNVPKTCMRDAVTNQLTHGEYAGYRPVIR